MVATASVEQTGNHCSRLFRAHACWVKGGSVVEGRGSVRMPFNEPIVVTPWNIDQQSPAGRSLLADGRDVSPTGVAFRHSEALPYKYAAVSFRGAGLGNSCDDPLIDTVLVRLLWCRFMRTGAYLSGGRFEQSLGPDFGQAFTVLLRSAEITAPVRLTRAAFG